MYHYHPEASRFTSLQCLLAATKGLSSHLSRLRYDVYYYYYYYYYRGADKSLARPRRKQATATEDFDVHISCL